MAIWAPLFSPSILHRHYIHVLSATFSIFQNTLGIYIDKMHRVSIKQASSSTKRHQVAMPCLERQWIKGTGACLMDASHMQMQMHRHGKPTIRPSMSCFPVIIESLHYPVPRLQGRIWSHIHYQTHHILLLSINKWQSKHFSILSFLATITWYMSCQRHFHFFQNTLGI